MTEKNAAQPSKYRLYVNGHSHVRHKAAECTTTTTAAAAVVQHANHAYGSTQALSQTVHCAKQHNRSNVV
jgi:hypothetical protein